MTSTATKEKICDLTAVALEISNNKPLSTHVCGFLVCEADWYRMHFGINLGT